MTEREKNRGGYFCIHHVHDYPELGIDLFLPDYQREYCYNFRNNTVSDRHSQRPKVIPPNIFQQTLVYQNAFKNGS